MFKYMVEKEYIHCHRKLMLKNLVFSIDFFVMTSNSENLMLNEI